MAQTRRTSEHLKGLEIKGAENLNLPALRGVWVRIPPRAHVSHRPPQFGGIGAGR